MTRTRLVAGLFALAIVAGACGDTAPSAAPTASDAPASAPAAQSAAPAATTAPATALPAATASPEPTPAAVDAAAAFASVMRDPLFTARVTIDGAGTLGSVPTTVTGSLAIGERATHLVRKVTVGRAASTSEVITASGTRYVATGDLWFDGGATLGDELRRTIGAVDGTVTETGLETVGGRELHHLVITPPPTLAGAMAVTAEDLAGFAGTMEAWVEDDGTPVLMRLGAEWDQPEGKKTVHGTWTVDLTFDGVGSEVAIEVPEQLWTWSTSKRYGYRMAYPVDWQYEKASKPFIDAYWGYDGDAVFAERFKSFGFTLNRAVDIITADGKVGNVTGRVTSNKPGKLGKLPARILVYSGKSKQQKYSFIAYVAVKGPWIYWVDLRTRHKPDADDRALIADFASTFVAK